MCDKRYVAFVIQRRFESPLRTAAGEPPVEEMSRKEKRSRLEQKARGLREHKHLALANARLGEEADEELSLADELTKRKLEIVDSEFVREKQLGEGALQGSSGGVQARYFADRCGSETPGE